MKGLKYFIALFFIFSASGCIKIKDTYVFVTVIDVSGNNVGAGTSVYMHIDNPESNAFPSPVSSFNSAITNNEGIAQIVIPAGDFIDYGKTFTRFFTTYNKIDEFDYEITGNVSATIKYGEEYDITINQIK